MFPSDRGTEEIQSFWSANPSPAAGIARALAGRGRGEIEASRVAAPDEKSCRGHGRSHRLGRTAGARPRAAARRQELEKEGCARRTHLAGCRPSTAAGHRRARDRPMNIRVECYAGYRGEETPRRFFIGDRAVEVIDVIDRWLAPDHRYFKVGGGDGAVYILRHDVGSERWELTMFDRREDAP